MHHFVSFIGLTGIFILLALSLGAFAAARQPPQPHRLKNGSFTVELSGFDIHYEIHGCGPVLMTVPNSWGLTLQGLRGLFRPLERNFTLVYFDPRGMGRSGAVRQEADLGLAAVRADFDALRRHLGLEQVSAIGWSNGAINLLLLAAERPGTLSRVIFVHGFARMTEEDDRVLTARQPELIKKFLDFLESMNQAKLPPAEADKRFKKFYVEDYFPAICADPARSRPLLKKLYRQTGFSWRHTRYSFQELPNFDFRDRLPAITTRCLVIAGAHDLGTPEMVKLIHDGIPGSEFIVFPHSGHFSPMEEPEAFVAAVRKFIGTADRYPKAKTDPSRPGRKH